MNKAQNNFINLLTCKEGVIHYFKKLLWNEMVNWCGDIAIRYLFSIRKINQGLDECIGFQEPKVQLEYQNIAGFSTFNNEASNSILTSK